MLLTYTPSTLVHVTLPEIFHAGLLTLPSLCSHPIPHCPHTFFRTQVPACLPHWLSTLCKVTPRSLPSGTLASSYCLYTLFHTNSTQKAPIYFHCHPETFPSQPFPFTLFLLSGSPRASPSGPSVHSRSVPGSAVHSHTHTHTHTHTHQGSQHSHTLVVAAPHTSNTLFPAFPYSLHIHLPITN